MSNFVRSGNFADKTSEQAPYKTLVKICGITREIDAEEAFAAGCDALGFNFYQASPRYIDPLKAKGIIGGLSSDIAVVALFVDPERSWVESVLSTCRVDLLQFHGSEPADFCESFARPYMKAVALRKQGDLAKAQSEFKSAQALLLDAYDEKLKGGTGKTFNWDLIDIEATIPIVLAGGLNSDNVADGIIHCRPFAVDVSGGVEQERIDENGDLIQLKGVKDKVKINKFLSAVAKADEQLRKLTTRKD